MTYKSDLDRFKRNVHSEFQTLKEIAKIIDDNENKILSLEESKHIKILIKVLAKQIGQTVSDVLDDFV